MTRRSRIIFAIGLIVALAGGALTYASTRDRDGGPTVSVLYAAKPIPAGTTGANAAGQGMVQSRSVPASAKPPNALSDVSELAGKAAAENLDAGTVLTTSAFAPAQTRIGTVRIPSDKTALAVRMENVAGVAGFAGAGDKVDIFGAREEGRDGPEVRMVLQGVDVLNVNGTTLVPTPGQPDGPGLVFLLAVSPSEAERLVYLSTFERLYFSLVPRDRAPVRPTPGTGAANALNVA